MCAYFDEPETWSALRCAKKSFNIASHLACKIPGMTVTEEWRRSFCKISMAEPQAPNRGSVAPKITDRIRAFKIAPAHIEHGSRVT